MLVFLKCRQVKGQGLKKNFKVFENDWKNVLGKTLFLEIVQKCRICWVYMYVAWCQIYCIMKFDEQLSQNKYVDEHCKQKQKLTLNKYFCSFLL